MNKSGGWRTALKKWGWDASTNAVGSIAGALLLAGVVAVASFFRPSNKWLYSEVYLWGGWALVLIVGIAVAGGFLAAHFLYRRSRRRPSDSPFGSVAVPRQSVPFQPNDLESRVIRLLRLADGKWANFSQMVKQLAVSSQQDLRQALRKLEAEGWIEANEDNYVMKDGAQSYRLEDAGITYARAHGYKTLTEIEREQAAKE